MKEARFGHRCEEVCVISVADKASQVHLTLFSYKNQQEEENKCRDIPGGPKRMQRFWSVISTTFLIEFHWFLLYWIEYYFQVIWHQVHKVWIRRFDSRAIILRQCHFQMCYFSPANRLEAVGIYFIWRLCWQKHNCPHFEKEDNMNESEAFITQLCDTKFQLLQASLRGKK